jgi:hypothetical protein
MSPLPLTNRHLTEHEKANLAVVLQAYRDGEGDSLDPQGTFLGPFQTPIGPIQPTGAKIDFPTADFWYLRNGKVEVFDCHIAFTTMFAQLGVQPDYASAVAASAPAP